MRWTLFSFGSLHITEMFYEYRTYVALERHYFRGRGHRFPSDCYMGCMEFASGKKEKIQSGFMAFDLRFVSS